MAFHVLVYAHMGLAVLVVENACTELVDITSVMSQSRLRNVVIAGTGNLLVAVADKVFAGTFRVVRFDHKNLPFLAVFYRPESPSVPDYRMSFP